MTEKELQNEAMKRIRCHLNTYKRTLEKKMKEEENNKTTPPTIIVKNWVCRSERDIQDLVDCDVITGDQFYRLCDKFKELQYQFQHKQERCVYELMITAINNLLIHLYVD